MNKINDVIIIGGGMSGLLLSYELSKKNIRTVILEKEDFLGGLIRPLNIRGYPIEGFYHHCFTDDHYILKVCLELKVKINWFITRTGFLFEDRILPFSSCLDIFMFNKLNWFQKASLGVFLARLISIKDTELAAYDGISAKEWIKNRVGEDVFRIFFDPLLYAKFGVNADVVSAAWLIGRLKMRSQRNFIGEKLGYFKHGFQELISALEQAIIARGGSIKLSSKVERIFIEDGKAAGVIAKGLLYRGKTVISTLAPLELSEMADFPDSFKKKITLLESQGSICVLLWLRKKVTDYYWINIMKKEIFGVFIEHTNYQKAQDYGGEHIIYLASYPDNNSYLWGADDAQIIDIYRESFLKIFKNVKKEDILWAMVVKSRSAGPIYRKGLFGDLLDYATPITGLYICSMFNCYPDRGLKDVGRSILKCIESLELGSD